LCAFKRSVDHLSRLSLLSTLKAIHKAGIIHGDIRLPNLCVDSAGEARIIDFSHASQDKSTEARAREITELCMILDMESKPRTKPVTEKAPDVIGLRRSTRIKEMKEKAEAKKTHR
jgi:tRNA A-37 threonylcarbamoyl transferase component Bud32